MICDACGNPIEVGSWPYCPHGKGGYANIPDDIPGGMVVENGLPAPMRVYSHSEHRRELAKYGREIAAKWAGPNDKIMTNWAAGSVDLAGAEAFIRSHYGIDERESEARQNAQEFPITVSDITFTKDA